MPPIPSACGPEDVGIGGDPCQPEVAELGMPVRQDENVGRFDVAMGDAFRVGHLERMGDVFEHDELFRTVSASRSNSSSNGSPGTYSMMIAGSAAPNRTSCTRTTVASSEAGQHPRFALEALHCVRVCHGRRTQIFDGHQPIQGDVAGERDVSEAAGSEPPQRGVAAGSARQCRLFGRPGHAS